MMPAPTAIPHRTRPTISTSNPRSRGAAAMAAEPATLVAQAKATVPRRPSRESASVPLTMPPIAETRFSEPTSVSTCRSVSSRSRCMTRLAPLMTPMS